MITIINKITGTKTNPLLMVPFLSVVKLLNELDAKDSIEIIISNNEDMTQNIGSIETLFNTFKSQDKEMNFNKWFSNYYNEIQQRFFST